MPDILPGAHDFVLNNSTVIANAGLTRPGLELLLEKSMRDAFHDSSARWPPPLCHPGTRQDYIEKLTGWGIGALGQQIFWMHGPAGVGKSAVAQSCANFFAARKKLGAAVFLSRPNGRNDPDRFFTSISYQLAIRVESYGDHLDHRIQRNPTIITKSIAEQFQELLVNPISQLRAEGVDIGEWLIIIDGLDECGGKDGGDGKAEKYARDIQCDIVEMAAASVREGVLPFRWVFLSRPETHIVSSFTANNMRRISYHLELPVTRAIDNEIRLYLTDELQKIRERSGLPDTWPPAHEIATLVNVSAGLWIYPATLVRFIRDPDSSPVDQLDAVLALFKEGNGRTSSGHPLMELDLFYTLIMRRVPSRILPVVQRILLLFESSSMAVSQPFDWVKFGEVVNRPIVKVLGLSELQFENACSSLRAVLKFNPLSRLGITFYHASFMEFLADATRSNKFCVYSYLNPLRRELVERLSDVHARSTTAYPITDVTRSAPGPETQRLVYHWLIVALFWFCRWREPLDSSICTALLSFRFCRLPRLDPGGVLALFHPAELKRNIPEEFRDKIVRRCYNPIVHVTHRSNYVECWILGRGKNKVVLLVHNNLWWHFEPYPTLL